MDKHYIEYHEHPWAVIRADGPNGRPDIVCDADGNFEFFSEHHGAQLRADELNQDVKDSTGTYGDYYATPVTISWLMY